MADSPKKSFHILLVGNPNTGKSTLFNLLTGIRQRTGNYPGVTIEKKSGYFQHDDIRYDVTDVPGTYSLAASSADERIAVDAITGHIKGLAKPDCVICVVDASNLTRNLFLYSQISDMGIPIIIALNMMDTAKKRGIQIDTSLLSEKLGGVPVIPLSARQKMGIDELKKGIHTLCTAPVTPAQIAWPECVNTACSILDKQIAHHGLESLSPSESRRAVFDSNASILDRIGFPKNEKVGALDAARSSLRQAGYNPLAAEALIRYEYLHALTADCLQHPDTPFPSNSESIDKLLTHRVWGLLIFIGMMYLVFQSIYSWSAPFMDLIDLLTGMLANQVSPWFDQMPTLQSLVVDGMISGVGSVIIFLPQILILFFFIALLEDTGYMPRAAFLMDKIFSWCGLNGKCFVPLLSSYACAIPGILSARTIEDPKARLVTIFIAPLMSCSARLPVYVLIIGAFIEPVYGTTWAAITLLVMHFVGILIALPIAFLLNRLVLKTPAQPFVMELPHYHIPKLRDVLIRMWEPGKEFIIRAGTIIFAFSIILWALLYFPRPADLAITTKDSFVQSYALKENISQAAALESINQDETLQNKLDSQLSGAFLEQSYLGQFGKWIQPVFAPAGFDWKITVGVLASFPAREVIIATLGIIYNLGDDVDEESGHLREQMKAQRWADGPLSGQPVFTIPVAFSIMVFFALCMQCGATVAIIARETNWKWAVSAFFFNSLLAWVCAVLTYQIGMRIGL